MQHQFRKEAKLKVYTTYTFCIVPSRLMSYVKPQSTQSGNGRFLAYIPS